MNRNICITFFSIALLFSIQSIRPDEERRRIIRDILRDMNLNLTNDENTQAHLFKLKQPAALSEQEKKVDVCDRITKKFIGKIPLQLELILYYLEHNEKCKKDTIDINNAALIYGKTGTGKTQLLKAIAEEVTVPSLYLSASLLPEQYETSRKIRQIFENAKKLDKPVLILIDDIEIIAARSNVNTNKEYLSAKITLLEKLKEIQKSKNVMVAFATEDLESLDPAIKKFFSGATCEISELNLEQKAQLFKKLFADKNIAIEDKFAQRLAEVTYNNFSNRDIEYLVTTSTFKKFMDCTTTPENCNKPMCTYMRYAIDLSKKKANFKIIPTYCDGI